MLHRHGPRGHLRHRVLHVRLRHRVLHVRLRHHGLHGVRGHRHLLAQQVQYPHQLNLLGSVDHARIQLERVEHKLLDRLIQWYPY